MVNVPHLTRSRSKEELLDVVDSKTGQLSEKSSTSRETLKGDETQEEERTLRNSIGKQARKFAWRAGKFSDISGYLASITRDQCKSEVVLHDLEGSETTLQIKLDTAAGGDTTEAREKTQEDGKQHVEDSKQDGGQDTLNDTDYDVRDTVEPVEKTDFLGKTLNVGDHADQCDGYGPEDDEDHSDGPADGSANLALVGVHVHVGPNNVIGVSLDVAVGHTVRLVVSLSLGGHVGGNLSVEEDESTALRRVVFVVNSDFGALGLDFLVKTSNLFTAPVDGVDLLTHARHLAELVGGALLLGDVLVGNLGVDLDIGIGEGPAGILSLALLDKLVGSLDEAGLGRLELVAPLLTLVE